MNSVLARFIRYLIEHPLLVNLLLILIVLTAISSVMHIQKVGLPRVDMREVIITTLYPGASPEDVELNVTKKLEEALEEVEDLEFYSSTSMENRSVIRIKINENAEDLEDVKEKIRRAVDDVTDLPLEVDEKPKIFEDKSDNWAI